MCDQNNISAYHISSKYGVFDNLTACKINGHKYTKNSESNISVQFLTNNSVNISKDYNYVVITNTISGNMVYLPNITYNKSIKIKNESGFGIIVVGNFYGNITNYSLNVDDSKEFIFYANNNYWIVF